METEAIAMIAVAAALALLGIASTVRAWLPVSIDERASLPPGWLHTPINYIIEDDPHFQQGYIAGAWFVTDRHPDNVVCLVWPRFEADINCGTSEQRRYALGWMRAVRPTWEAAMGFDLPSVRQAMLDPKP